MKQKPMKQTVFIFVLTLLFAPANAQDLPSWAEPSEDRSFGTTQAEQQTPDRSQRERPNGLSGYDTQPFNRPQRNTIGRCVSDLGEWADWCSCKRANGGFVFSIAEKWCDKHYPPTPIPVDNPFAIGFLIACGFAYAYIKL
jgi:hypothetical protein